MLKKIFVILYCLQIVFIPIKGFSQAVSGRYVSKMITGVVLNKNTRLPIPSAEIKITKTDSNITYILRTDEKGVFKIDTRGLRSFVFEVKKFGYNAYSSVNYNVSLLAERNNYQLDEILMEPSIVYPPPKDTVKRKPEEFLERKFISLDLLPTSSAYQLFYDLNPELRGKDLVDPDYKVNQPKIPIFAAELKKQFVSKFKQEFKTDAGVQSILKDSINYCNRLYADFLYSTTISYKSTDKDSAQRILNIMYGDLNKLLPEANRTRSGKATELIKLTNSIAIILADIIKKQELTDTDAYLLRHIGLQFSLVLSYESSRNYFSGVDNDSTRTTGRINSTVSPFILTSNQENITNEMNVVGNPDLRAFLIRVYLSKNGQVISVGPDVEKRFQIICYPPALKSIRSTYRVCDSPATTSSITLSNAPYEFIVIDLRNGKQMKFVKGNAESEIISTEAAFRQMAKSLTGVNFTEIPFYIKED